MRFLFARTSSAPSTGARTTRAAVQQQDQRSATLTAVLRSDGKAQRLHVRPNSTNSVRRRTNEFHKNHNHQSDGETLENHDDVENFEERPQSAGIDISECVYFTRKPQAPKKEDLSAEALHLARFAELATRRRGQRQFRVKSAHGHKEKLVAGFLGRNPQELEKRKMRLEFCNRVSSAPARGKNCTISFCAESSETRRRRNESNFANCASGA